MYTSDAPAAYWRDQLFLWGPKVLLAILILVVTHFIAKAIQWALLAILVVSHSVQKNTSPAAKAECS